MTDAPVRTTRHTYDEVAGEYRRRNAGPFEDLAADIDALCRRVPAGARVADVGCGPGRDLAALRARGLRAIGLDLSLGMLEAGGMPGVAQADMRALPLPDAALDAVWCQAALLHLPLPDVPAALAEFARVLRWGGALHLAVAEGDGEGWQPYPGSGRPRWFSLHREEPLAALLSATGFAVHSAAHRRTNRDWLVLGARRTR
jgi:ubiquinone/menaquinone biosynthesis C-methylase UbiE